MIETPTLFILGAGASMAYQFPSGSVLRRKAINTLKDPRTDIFGLVRSCGFRDGFIAEFARNLEAARTESVDLFLVRNPQYNDLGNHVMAAVLTQLESCRDETGSDIEQDWYAYLFQRMFGTCVDDFLQNRLSIITFNFDRSFEWYMYRRLCELHASRCERGC